MVLTSFGPRLATIPAAIDIVFLNLVADYSFGGVKQLRRPLAVAARGLERILNYVAFIGADCGIQRKPADGARSFRRLQGRRQVMAVDDAGLTNQDRALDYILQFANVAGPMVAGEHVDRRRRYPLETFVMLVSELFHEVIGQQQNI